MISKIQEIYEAILKDPDLYETIVIQYLKSNPNAKKEEIHIFILDLIAKCYHDEADQEKKRRQLDIARDRIVSKILEDLPDSTSSTANKRLIKSSLLAVTNSGSGHEREDLADTLKGYSDDQRKRIKSREQAIADIERRK